MFKLTRFSIIRGLHIGSFFSCIQQKVVDSWWRRYRWSLCVLVLALLFPFSITISEASSVAESTSYKLIEYSINSGAQFRPSEGITPLDIGDVVLWLDASDSSSITLSNGNITQWNDKSGNNHHVAQSSEALAPVLSDTAINGHFPVAFDGVDDFLYVNTTVDITDTTMLIVLKLNSIETTGTYATAGVISIQPGNSSSYEGIAYSTTPSSLDKFMSASSYHYSTSLISSVSETLTDPLILLNQNIDNNYEMYRNGTTVVDVNKDPSLKSDFRVLIGNRYFTSAGVTPSSSGYWYGSVAEVIVFSKAITADERAKIQNYLAKKWGLLSEMDSDGDTIADASDSTPVGDAAGGYSLVQETLATDFVGKSSGTNNLFHGPYFSSSIYSLTGFNAFSRSTLSLSSQSSGLLNSSIEFLKVIDDSSSTLGTDTSVQDGIGLDWDTTSDISSDADVELWARAFDGLSYGPYFKTAEFKVDNEAPVISNMTFTTPGDALNSGTGSLAGSWSGSDNLGHTFDISYIQVSGEASTPDDPSSITFDGSDDYIRVDDFASLSNVTVSFWAKHNGSDSTYDRFIGSTDHKLNIAKDSTGQLKVHTLGLGWRNVDHVLSADVWTYITLTSDGTTLIVYVNGSEVSSWGSADLNFNGTDDWYFASTHGPGEYGNHSMDEIGIWDEALSQSEVTAIYNAGTSLDLRSNAGSYQSNENLKGYWKFDEGSGSTATDLSGNNKDGNIFGATWSTGSPSVSGTNGSGETTVAEGSSDTSLSVSNVTDLTDFKLKLIAKDQAGNETILESAVSQTPDRTAPTINDLDAVNGVEDTNFTVDLASKKADNSDTLLSWSAALYTTAENAVKSAEEIIQNVSISSDDISFVVSPNTNTEPAVGNIYAKDEAWLKLTLTDAAGNSLQKDIEINISAVNDPPVLNPDIGSDVYKDQYGQLVYSFLSNEDTSPSTIQLDSVVTDIDNPLSSLVWTASAPNLLLGTPAGNYESIYEHEFIDFKIGDTSLSHELLVEPQQDWYGDFDVTLKVSDGDASSFDEQDVIVRVWPVNDPPSAPGMPTTFTVDEDTQLVMDLKAYESDSLFEDETPTYDSQLTWTVLDYDTDFVSLKFEDQGADTVTLIPVEHKFGSSTLILQLLDTDLSKPKSVFPDYVPAPLATTMSVTVVWDSVNDVPVIADAIADQVVFEDGASWTLALGDLATDLESDDSSLTWSVSASDPTLLDISIDNTTKIATFTPKADKSGNSTLNFDVSDGTDTTQRQVSLSILPQNDIPSLAKVTVKGQSSQRMEVAKSTDVLEVSSTGYTDSGYEDDIRVTDGAEDEYAGGSNAKSYSYLWYINPVPQTPTLALWFDASDLNTLTTDSHHGVVSWKDKSLHGNHASQGLLTSRPTLLKYRHDEAGYRGLGESIQLVDAKLETMDSDAIDLNTLTIEMWVNFDQIPYTNQILLEKYGQYSLCAGDIDDRRLTLRYASDLTSWADGTLVGTTILEPNRWYYIAATYDGQEWALYLDGKKEATRIETGTLATGSNKLTLGQSNHNTDLISFTGKIDELRLWKEARTQEELVEYQYGAPVSSTLVRVWSFDKGTQLGTTIHKDLISNISMEETGTYHIHGENSRTNDKPVVRFDGLDDRLQGVLSESLSDKDMTFIAVIRDDSSHSSQSGIISTSGQAGLYSQAANKFKLAQVDSTPLFEATTAEDVRSFSILSGVYQGTSFATSGKDAGFKIEFEEALIEQGGDESSRLSFVPEYTLFVNGELKRSYKGSGVSLSSGNKFEIGGHTFSSAGVHGTHLNQIFKGEIAEILVFNAALPGTYRKDIEEYLNVKWGLGLPEIAEDIFIARESTTASSVTLSVTEVLKGRTVVVEAWPYDGISTGNVVAQQIFVNKPPNLTQPLSPTHGSEMSSETVVLKWRPGSDDDSSDAVSHRLKVWSVDERLSTPPEIDVTTSNVAYDSGWKFGSYDEANFSDLALADGHYWWTVFSANAFPGGDYDFKQPNWMRLVSVENIPAGGGSSSGPIDPSTISGMALWLDASNIDGSDNSTLSEGDAISTWTDFSGNGLHASQSNSGKRPALVTDSLNGLSTVSFSSDYLTTGIMSLFDNNDDGLTIFTIFKTSSAAGQKFLLNFGTYMNGQNGAGWCENVELGYSTGNTAAGNYGFHIGCSRASVTDAGTIVNNEWVMMASRIKSSGSVPNNVEFRKNGTVITTNQDQTGFFAPGSYPTVSAYLDIGARNDGGGGSMGNYHAGDIAEILVYKKELTDDEISNISLYLSQKWGLADIVDSDGDGIVDSSDTDADGDGVADSTVIADVAFSDGLFTLTDGVYEVVTSKNNFLISGVKPSNTSIFYKGIDGSSGQETDTEEVALTADDAFNMLIYPSKPTGNIYSKDALGNVTAELSIKVSFLIDPPTIQGITQSRVAINSPDNADLQALSDGGTISDMPTVADLTKAALSFSSDRDLASYSLLVGSTTIAEGVSSVPGFDPLSISGLKLWLDASDIDGDNETTDNPSNGSYITTWTDKSGNGNHGVSIASPGQPIYTTGALNSNGVIEFDGINDGMSLGDVTLESDYTIFIINRYSGAVQGRILQSRTLGRNWLMGRWQGTLGMYAAGWVAQIPSIGTVWTLDMGTRSGATNALYSDGALLGSQVDGDFPGQLGLLGSNWTGGTNYEQSNAQVAEIMVFDRPLTDDERADINVYLADKWGLTATVDSDGDGTVDASDADADGGGDPELTPALLADTALSIDILGNNTALSEGANEALLTITDEASNISKHTFLINRDTTAPESTVITLGNASLNTDGTYGISLTGTREPGVGVFVSVTDVGATSTLLTDPSSLSGLALWLDASNIDGSDNSTLSDGDSISMWTDLSGGGNHVAQATDSKKPTLITNSNKQYLSFDGSNDSLGADFTGHILDDPTGQSVTILTVVKPKIITGDGYILSSGGQTSSARGYALGNSAWSIFKDASGGPYIEFTSSFELNQTHLVTHSFDRSISNYDVLLNGSIETDSASTYGAASNLYHNFTIGMPNNIENYYGEFEIAEVIVISSVDSQKITDIQAYLAAKWGLESTVDSDGDGIVDASDSDADGDGVADSPDIMPVVASEEVGYSGLNFHYTNSSMDLQNNDLQILIRDKAYNQTARLLWNKAWYASNSGNNTISIAGFDGIIYPYDSLPNNIIKLFHKKLTKGKPISTTGLSLRVQSVVFDQDKTDDGLAISPLLAKHTYQIYGRDFANEINIDIDLSDHAIHIGIPIEDDIHIETDRLVAVRYDNETDMWIAPTVPQLLNEDASIMKITIDKTGVWALAEYMPFATTFAEMRLYPNPWVPNDGADDTGDATGITFDNLMTDSQIRIYTITGQLVVNTIASGSSYIWDGKNLSGDAVFSGVYLYMITAGDDSDTKRGKLTIIR